MGLRRTVVVALVAGVVAAGGGAARAAAAPLEDAVGIRLLDAPTRRADDPRAQLYVVDHVRPGATVTRRVELSNGTRSPVRLALYAAGAEVLQGQFRFHDGRAANELAGWTSVQPGRVEVPAGGPRPPASPSRCRRRPRPANATPSSGPSCPGATPPAGV